MERSWLNDLRALPARKARPRLSPEALEQRLTPALGVVNLSGGVTPAQMVSTLIGANSGLTISNVTFSGNDLQAGIFAGGTGIVGIESGIVLGSGIVNDVLGPNLTPQESTVFGGPGDPDLDGIAPLSFDASVLQFDFVAQGDTLRFDFVFASDEYTENIDGFNDTFGVFLNGQSIGLLPGTSVPAGIQTINQTVNAQFFINNDVQPVAPLDTEMDGLTTRITVQMNVTPGVTNSLKLAIGDAGDGTVDSNVFLAAGSFRVPPLPVFTTYRPYRYAFRELEQNVGLTAPVPLGGTAREVTFDGNLTVLNVGDMTAIGDFRLTFRQLPEGARVVNATGVGADGDPFIIIRNLTLPSGGTLPLRLPIKIANPGLESLGTFYAAPYFVEARPEFP